MFVVINILLFVYTFNFLLKYMSLAARGKQKDVEDSQRVASSMQNSIMTVDNNMQNTYPKSRGIPRTGSRTCPSALGQKEKSPPVAKKCISLTIGSVGATGPQGPQGMKGDKGLQGVSGTTGLQGMKGDKGVDGTKGLTGATGPQGPQGMKGDKGLDGSTGMRGLYGPQGEKGNTGSTGPQGNEGQVGGTGPQGEKGNTGSTGPQGEKGLRGLSGFTGPRGLLSIEGDLSIGDTLKYDGEDTWIPTGSVNLYLGGGTLENASNPNARFNIGLGYKAGIGQDDPDIVTDGAIAVGYQSGGKTEDGVYQSTGGIAIGMTASNKGQGHDAISIGTLSGAEQSQHPKAIAIGHKSGCDEQGESSIAIGDSAGCIKQGKDALSIGKDSGRCYQSVGAIAIGAYSGKGDDLNNKQGEYSIAIGYKAAWVSQYKNSIILDASGTGEIETSNIGFFVNPVREINIGESVDRLRDLKYDIDTHEIIHM